MSVWAVITAALPIPATLAGFIPTFGAHTKVLSVYTSLFCFLSLALIFYFRHSLARYFFSTVIAQGSRVHGFAQTLANALPAVLVVLCAISAFSYQALLTRSVADVLGIRSAAAAAMAQMKAFERLEAGDKSATSLDSIRTAIEKELEVLGGPDTRTTSEVLADTDLPRIPFGGFLVVLYLLTFLFAEGAFILMALREYLQDILGVTDNRLIEAGFPTYVGEEEQSIRSVRIIWKAILWPIAILIVPGVFAAFIHARYQIALLRGGLAPSLFSPRMVLAAYAVCLVIGTTAAVATTKRTGVRILVALLYLVVMSGVLFVLHTFVACWSGDCT
jgi:hypothetical protein